MQMENISSAFSSRQLIVTGLAPFRVKFNPVTIKDCRDS